MSSDSEFQTLSRRAEFQAIGKDGTSRYPTRGALLKNLAECYRGPYITTEVLHSEALFDQLRPEERFEPPDAPESA